MCVRSSKQLISIDVILTTCAQWCQTSWPLIHLSGAACVPIFKIFFSSNKVTADHQWLITAAVVPMIALVLKRMNNLSLCSGAAVSARLLLKRIGRPHSSSSAPPGFITRANTQRTCICTFHSETSRHILDCSPPCLFFCCRSERRRFPRG